MTDNDNIWMLSKNIFEEFRNLSGKINEKSYDISIITEPNWKAIVTKSCDSSSSTETIFM